MSNMGYARFRNTLEDLRDCYRNWDDDLEPEEEEAREKLVNLCRKIINERDERDGK